MSVAWLEFWPVIESVAVPKTVVPSMNVTVPVAQVAPVVPTFATSFTAWPLAKVVLPPATDRLVFVACSTVSGNAADALAAKVTLPPYTAAIK